MYLRYIKNKRGIVEELDNGDILVRSRLDDTFFEAEVELLVKLPGLEILSAKGEMRRAFNDECKNATNLLQKVVGTRIGPGLTKRVRDALSGSDGCPRMADLVLECCNEVILAFTADQLRDFLLKNDILPDEFSKEFLSQNPRVLGSCITYSPESPLRKRLGI